MKYDIRSRLSEIANFAERYWFANNCLIKIDLIRPNTTNEFYQSTSTHIHFVMCFCLSLCSLWTIKNSRDPETKREHDERQRFRQRATNETSLSSS